MPDRLIDLFVGHPLITSAAFDLPIATLWVMSALKRTRDNRGRNYNSVSMAIQAAVPLNVIAVLLVLYCIVYAITTAEPGGKAAAGMAIVLVLISISSANAVIGLAGLVGLAYEIAKRRKDKKQGQRAKTKSKDNSSFIRNRP